MPQCSIWSTAPFAPPGSFHELKKPSPKLGDHSSGYGSSLLGPSSIQAPHRHHATPSAPGGNSKYSAHITPPQWREAEDEESIFYAVQGSMYLLIEAPRYEDKWGSGGLEPHICLRGKSPRHSRETDWVDTRGCGEEKNLLPPLGSRPARNPRHYND